MEEEFDKMFDKLVAQATIIEEQWRRRLNKSNGLQEERSKRESGVTKDDNLAKLDETGADDSGYESEFDHRNMKGLKTINYLFKK